MADLHVKDTGSFTHTLKVSKEKNTHIFIHTQQHDEDEREERRRHAEKKAKSQNIKRVTKLIFSNNILFHLNLFIFDVNSESLHLCADYTCAKVYKRG